VGGLAAQGAGDVPSAEGCWSAPAPRAALVPKRLAPIFRDREELASATDLGTVISEALQQSACQIVICSPQAAKSKWVNEEIIAFKRLGREDRIFCLIVGGEPNATDLPNGPRRSAFLPRCAFGWERITS
jgi:hypothetical protein